MYSNVAVTVLVFGGSVKDTEAERYGSWAKEEVSFIRHYFVAVQFYNIGLVQIIVEMFQKSLKIIQNRDILSGKGTIM